MLMNLSFMYCWLHPSYVCNAKVRLYKGCTIKLTHLYVIKLFGKVTSLTFRVKRLDGYLLPGIIYFLWLLFGILKTRRLNFKLNQGIDKSLGTIPRLLPTFFPGVTAFQLRTPGNVSC